MANLRLIAAVRELAEAGWKRDLTFGRKSIIIVWTDPDDRMHIVLEPGIPGWPWATLRIGQYMDRGGPVLQAVMLADCKVGSWQAALGVLNAYGLVADQHTSAYAAGVAHTIDTYLRAVAQ